MGWTSCDKWKTIGQVRAAILRECFVPGRVIDTASTPGAFWVLGRSADGKSRITLFMLDKIDGNYAYKDIGESMTPEATCPVAWLDKADAQADKAPNAEWRAECREHAALAGRSLTGRISLHGVEYDVKEALGRGAYLVHRVSDGHPFKLPKRMIADATTVAPVLA